ncbi:F0F1 ATP synthase subunit delta [Auritidibacter ignavus]|uniref:F0F1 ATP synthase subunit delta n=1 Tax=Auritidibacter ignavus TaxID=678932 RepID=UPI00109C8687|nr:F0F1 ATP synthase subunit delta [Auritidibacter ignavus]
MSLASSDSLANISPELESFLTSNGLDTARELFAALRVIDQQGALRRSLADPTAESTKRQGLVERIFSDHVGANALGVLRLLVGQRWSKERELGDAIETAAAQASAASAEGEGLAGLQQLTEQLLGFDQLIQESHQVQWALSDQQAPASARGDLAVKLVGVNAREETKALVRQAVEAPRGAKPAAVVRHFANVVATRQRRWIADVTVAKPLQQSQQDRLARGLSAAFGRELTLNVEVDPQLVGGIRVQVGDEVVDSSISARLNDLKTKMAG